MKEIITLLFTSLIFIIGHCQDSFDPKVIVLLPVNIHIDKGINDKIDFYYKYAIKLDKEYLIDKKDSLLLLIAENDSLPENYKRHYENKIKFASNLDFTNHLVQHYASSFHEVLTSELKNALVLIDTCSSFIELNAMKTYAELHNADYIVNITNLDIEKYKRDILVTPKFTVYSRIENIVHDINPWDLDQYNKSSISLGNKNLIVYRDDIYATTDVQRLIKENGDVFKRQLKHNRNEILENLFYTGIKSKSMTDELKKFNMELNSDTYYTSVSNKDSSQLISFYISEGQLPMGNDKSTRYIVRIVYSEKNSEVWKHEFLHNGIYIFMELSEEDQVKETFMKLKNMFFFEKDSVNINPEFWNEKLFIKYKIRFMV